MSNAVVIESLGPPVMDIYDCGDDITLEWRVAIGGKPTTVRLHFCRPCAIDYLAADAEQTQNFERAIAARIRSVEI